MPSIDSYIDRVRWLQSQGLSENEIKEFLTNEDLNEYQISTILSTLKPPQATKDNEVYLKLRRGINFSRWQVATIIRLVAFLIGIVVILAVLLAVILKGANISNFILLLIIAGGLLLFSSGFLD